MSFCARSRPARHRAAFLALGLLGCGSGSSGPSDAGGADVAAHRVVLGTGREAFEAVPPDGRVPIILGLQGGYHVWTSFLAYGFETDVLRMRLSTRWEALEASLVEVAVNVSVRPVEDPMGAPALVSLGWFAGIFDPVCAHDQPLQFSLTVTDDAGNTASDSQRWIIDVAEAYRSSDCAR